MWKFFLCFSIFLAAEASMQGALECYNGTAVYFMNGTIETTLYLSRTGCSPEEICGGYSWINEDDKGYRRIVETRFCTRYNVTDCRYLDGQPDVGNISECVPQTCSEHLCNDFNGSVCDVGSLVYTTDMALVVLDFDASVAVCSVGETCAMYRFLNFDYENNYQSYVEYGRCVSTNATASCSDLKEIDVIGMVSNCSVDNCSESGCPVFSKQIPPQPWYSCDQGTFVYSAETGAIVSTENISHDPCSSGQACWMARFINEDGGVSHYVESGECVNVSLISYYNCDAIKMSNDTANVTSCSTISCSGDYCVRFSPLQPQPGCPARANNDDIQILPGCTLRQGLKKVFSCFEEIGSDYPYSNEDNCSAAFDRMVQCLSQVAQDCIAISENGTLCPSVLNFLGTESISQILKMIRSISGNISDFQSLISAMNLQFPDASPHISQQIGALCGNKSDVESLIEMIRSNVEMLDFGFPVCLDQQILDDLTEEQIEFTKSLLMAQNKSDVCLAFNRFKAEIENAIVTRCWSLTKVSELLAPAIGPYFSGLLQQSVDIVRYFLSDLEIPGCEGFSRQIACHQGVVVYSPNATVVYLELDVNVSVCSPNEVCGMFRFDNIDSEGRPSYIESGFCFNPSYFQPTCQDLPSYSSELVKASGCSFASCDESRCLAFSRDNCQVRNDSDISLLPRCSLSQTLSRGFDCFNTFYGNFPYSDVTQCRRDIEEVGTCIAFSLTDCASGNCESIFDRIFPNWRQMIKEIVGASTENTKLEALLNLFGINGDIREVLLSSMCSQGNNNVILEQIIKRFYKEIIYRVTNFTLPGCDDQILKDVLMFDLEAVLNILNATDHREVCRTSSNAVNRILEALDARCEVVVHEEIKVSGNILDEIRLVTPIVIRLLRGFQFPNCHEEEGGNAMLLECSRFSKSESSCSARQAWLCDYVTWKLQFLGQWRNEFLSYISQNNLIYPESILACLSTPSSGLCKNGDQTRCERFDDGCEFCYCLDQLYRNETAVMEVYRKDWNNWKSLFQVYKLLNSSDHGCNLT